MTEHNTPEDALPSDVAAAPYVGRLLLAVDDADREAAGTALIDANAAGITTLHLLAVMTRAVVLHLNHRGDDWKAEVRLGLLEASE